MKMHALSGGRLRMRKSIYFSGADRSETMDLPVSSFLIRHPQGNVLFDSGCHPSVATDAQSRWGGMAKIMQPIAPPGDNVVDNLKAIGFSADDVDVVICSHLHPDHCGCNAFFRKATMIVHAKELAAAREPNAENAGYLAVDWDIPGGYQEIAGEHDVFGDGRIVLVPAPGHTPGSIAALVKLDRSGSFLLASDSVSIRAMLDQDVIPKNMWDAETARASLAEIRRMEARGITVLCGHDAAQWASLKKGADAYD